MHRSNRYHHGFVSSIVFFLWTPLFHIAQAQSHELPTTSPEVVGMSSEKLGLVKPALQNLVDDQRVPGAIVMVARHGKIVLFDSVGYRDIHAKKPMQTDSILRFYSMTKPITSVAIMMLAEQKKLNLDDAISKWIPEFSSLPVFVEKTADEVKLASAQREATIRDLLRHTSGLTYGFFGNTFVDQKYRTAGVLRHSDTLQETILKLSKIPLLHQPGSTFNYSVSTDVLGYIVERVSGQRLDEFLKEHIFAPLQMHDTSFRVPPEKISRFSNNYGPKRVGPGLRVIDDIVRSRYLKAPTHYSGGGGSVSTASDYMRFCQLLLNKGEFNGQRLLQSETIEQMTRNQLPDEAYPINLNGRRDGVGFGLGFSVVVEKTKYTQLSRLGEYGWGGAASTHFWISPKDDLAVIVLTQHMPFSFLLENTVKPLVYGAITD